MTVSAEHVAVVGAVLALLGVLWRAARVLASIETRLAVLESVILGPVQPRARSEPPGGA